jgi:hypothetical protein
MTETTMAKQQTISRTMRAHLQELADRNYEAGLPERAPAPQRPKVRKPMSGPIRGAIYVDGQFVGDTKRPALAVTHAAPLTEEEERAERKARKAQELADRLARWNKPDRRPQKAPQKPLSPAVAQHFLHSLMRSEID